MQGLEGLHFPRSHQGTTGLKRCNISLVPSADRCSRVHNSKVKTRLRILEGELVQQDRHQDCIRGCRSWADSREKLPYAHHQHFPCTGSSRIPGTWTQEQSDFFNHQSSESLKGHLNLSHACCLFICQAQPPPQYREISIPLCSVNLTLLCHLKASPPLGQFRKPEFTSLFNHALEPDQNK